MFVEMVLGLKDVPGMLVRALEPISGTGGNIVSVLHSRGKKVVAVNVAFKVKDDATLNRIIGALRARRISIRAVNVEGHRYYRKRSVAFILLGHVIDQDVQDTIDEINKVGLVRDIDVRMGSPKDESAVMMKVNVDEDRLANLMECVKEICNRKRFLIVRGVGA
jgi:ACT domain-containing protein